MRNQYINLLRRKLSDATRALIIVQITAADHPAVVALMEEEAAACSRALAVAVSL